MITCLENSFNKLGELCSIYRIEPLEIGDAITLGNSLRRVLLSKICGLGINYLKFYGFNHEYINLSFLHEDTLELISNLKKVTFKKLDNSIKSYYKASINSSGPKIITANSIYFLNNQEITIINPSQYLCTINQNLRLHIDLYINESYGYKNLKNFYNFSYNKKLHSFIQLDTLYNPIKRVNYKVCVIHDKKGFLKESLILEILTNGAISPSTSLRKALQILLQTFFPLIYTI